MQLNKRKRYHRKKIAQQQTRTAARASTANSLMAAALALPGMLAPQKAQPETPPEKTFVSVKYLHYRDYQPGIDRMKVTSPSVYFITPIKGVASVEGSYTIDSVSGASPFAYSNVITTPSIRDERKAGDLKFSRYLDRATLGASVAWSREQDYDSNAVGLEARFSSADNNRTFALGFGHARDKISTAGTNDNEDRNGKRRTSEFLIGVTQVLSPNALVQSNLTYADGKGYHNDPYRLRGNDRRPRERKQWAWLTRYVRYLPNSESALHTSYRYYRSDWGVRAHTLESAWYKPFGNGWLIRPSVRYYSQTKADFYVDPPPPPAIAAFPLPELFTPDQRLSSFGAVTLGLKLVKEFQNDWAVDAKYEIYQQRTSWRIDGEASPGLETFKAKWWTVGANKKF